MGLSSARCWPTAGFLDEASNDSQSSTAWLVSRWNCLRRKLLRFDDAGSSADRRLFSDVPESGADRAFWGSSPRLTVRSRSDTATRTRFWWWWFVRFFALS